MCGRGRAGVRQERTAQYGGRMFVFATTQGVQGDLPSAIARGRGEKSKSRVAPCLVIPALTRDSSCKLLSASFHLSASMVHT